MGIGESVSISSFDQSYYDICLKRLLSSLDRRKFSKSYGCFDKDFWHFKTKSFPSAARQQGIHALALALKFDEQKNDSQQSQYLLECLEAGISYLQSIQKSDGSFDEWYINERGWAGPCAYLLHSLCRTYHLVGNSLSPQASNSIKFIVDKIITHLSKSDEPEVIANHIAIVAASVFEASRLFHNPIYEQLYLKMKAYFFKYVDDEGWALEYDGVDLAYMSASISFLSFIHELNQDSEIEEFSKKSLGLFQYFIDQDGLIFGTIGSRNTQTHFYRGIEYWSQYDPIASLISEKYRGVNDIGPLEQDDHYFIYRVCDLWEAKLLENSIKKVAPSQLPIEGDEFSLFLRNADIFIKNSKEHYFICHLKKGGASIVYGKSDRKLRSDSGLILKLKNRFFVSEIYNDSFKTLYNEDEGYISIEGYLSEFQQKYFNILTQVAFNFFMLIFARHRYLAMRIKSIIKKVLIVKSQCSRTKFSKKIDLNDFRIELKLHNIPLDSESLLYRGITQLRYVPQSRYFTGSDCTNDLITVDLKKRNDNHLELEYQI